MRVPPIFSEGRESRGLQSRGQPNFPLMATGPSLPSQKPGLQNVRNVF
jgi:hypothetical protein